jgi:hypothetical protein
MYNNDDPDDPSPALRVHARYNKIFKSCRKQ